MESSGKRFRLSDFAQQRQAGMGRDSPEQESSNHPDGLPRMELVFSSDVFQYITVMAAAAGVSVSSFVNAVLARDSVKRMEDYAAAKAGLALCAAGV